MGVKRFKSKAAYGRWLAYGHMHGLFDVPGHQTVYVRGKRVRVKHKKR